MSGVVMKRIVGMRIVLPGDHVFLFSLRQNAPASKGVSFSEAKTKAMMNIVKSST